MKPKSSVLILGLILGAFVFSNYAYAVNNGSILTGNLTVTGTCTGCGSEGSFTNYTPILNTTISSSIVLPRSSWQVDVTNNGTLLVTSGFDEQYIINKTGSVIFTNGFTGSGTNISGIHQGQSVNGEYSYLIRDTQAGLIKLAVIRSQTTLLGNYTITSAQFINNGLGFAGTGISASGKYIAIFGEVPGGTSMREVLLQGS